MPDFDIDFCMDKRDEVIDYVREKYGADERRADRDLPSAQEPQRGARRGARDGLRAGGRRAHRDADPRAGGRQERAHRERARPGAAAQGAVRRRPADQEPPRHRDGPRGPDAARGHARRRRGDQRGSALGSRAGLLPGARHLRHPVRQGRRRGRWPGEVRLPGAQDTHRHRHRRRTHRQAPRPRRQPFDISAIPMDDPATFALLAVGGDHQRLPARVERHADALQAAQAGLLRGHRRRRRALSPGSRSAPAWSRTSSSESTGEPRSSIHTPRSKGP